jgi:hypothetical protein
MLACSGDQWQPEIHTGHQSASQANKATSILCFLFARHKTESQVDHALVLLAFTVANFEPVLMLCLSLSDWYHEPISHIRASVNR